jgi:hypothetical protein
MDPQGQGVAQVTELKCKDPSSFPSTEPKKKKKREPSDPSQDFINPREKLGTLYFQQEPKQFFKMNN